MSRHVASLIVFSAALGACTSDSTTPVDGVPPEDVAVGDTMFGGQVVEHGGDASCRFITIEHDPVWDDCSADQLRVAQVGAVGVLPDSAGAPVAANPNPTPQLTASTCTELADLRRPILQAAQRAVLQNQRQAALAKNCLPQRETKYFDKTGPVGYCWLGGYGPPAQTQDAGSAVPLPSTVADNDDGASSYSTTNTQVADVDEADFVKNDAGYVYVLSPKGLHVIDAWPAADSHELTFLALPEPPTRLFLSGDKLVVYGRTGGASGAPSAAQGCTYGYDCRAQAEAGGTVIRVFDVSSPAAPRELRSYELSGGYVASRRVGDFVYTVVSDQNVSMAPGADLQLQGDDAASIEQNFTAKVAEADALVEDLDDGYFLPWARETRMQAASSALPCDDGLAARASQGESFTSLVTFDLSTLGAPHRTLVATNAGFVYAASDALYLAADGSDGASDTWGYRASTDTSIHKFTLDGAVTRYEGSGAVPGHVLNQFSMDAQGGYLRVATSEGWVPDPSVTSRISVLGAGDGALTTVGTLAGLAPQEDIRSVRFDGDRMFMVTFKKTDPLFAIDLSDPRAPRVLGELKIPGFSTYMHPLDHDHLLAIGFDADDHGDFAYFDGIQLQIFDIHDLATPTLLHKTVIGTRGSASDALTNHLAFNYFAPQKKLALPMTVCAGGDDGNYGTELQFSGLMLFDVSLESGIVESGRMPFADVSAAQGYGSCSSWWSSGSSLVKRSIFMDEFVIGLSDDTYKVAATAAAGTVLKTIPLTP